MTFDQRSQNLSSSKLDLNSFDHSYFVQLTKKDSLEEAEEYLKTHPDFLTWNDRFGYGALHHAIKDKHESVVELLLQVGSQICHDSRGKMENSFNSPNWNGSNLIHLAARIGSYSIFRKLLQFRIHGSSDLKCIDVSNYDQITPLHWAAWNGHTSIMELLLRLGSQSLNSTSRAGSTPLYLALCWGQKSNIRILRAVGGLIFNPDRLSAEKLEMISEPIPEEEILEIRGRIYFDHSLVSRLLFLF